MAGSKSESAASRFDKARAVFRKHGGVLRTAQALAEGVHPETLYSMRDSAELEAISRGVYRLADGPPLGHLDLVVVASRVPNGVICLISALAYHELTTQIPHAIHLALPPGVHRPRLAQPPIHTYRFSGESFTAGLETHTIDAVPVRIYSPEKTLADCFKFRNQVGMDTAVEAIRLYRERRRAKIEDLLHYASICRVKRIIRPYLEALLT